MVIYVVIAHGPLVLGAYTTADSAHLHARCVTGASAVECELLEQVSAEIREDIYQAEVEDFDEETPVDPIDDGAITPPLRRR